MDSDEVAVLTALLEAGGKAVLSGQNILDGDAGSQFGMEMLGAAVGEPSVESRSIVAFGGEVFDDLFAFEIEGGSGADNQDAPSALSPVNGGRGILNYDSGVTLGEAFENRRI